MGISSLSQSSAGATPGLVYITSTSFSAVTSVSVNNCFTSAYSSYRVILDLTSTSGTAVNIFMRMRVSGVDATTNYNWASVSNGWTNTVGGSGASSATSAQVAYVATAGPEMLSLDITNPFAVARTGWAGHGQNDNASNQIAGYHNTGASYDGFSIYPSSGTFTGSLTVYGYNT